ncbi:RNA polymerase factor sigma-54 [Mesorhizobium sp. A556]
MNITASVQLIPTQTLAVTPQLIQSIQVLQYSGQELDAYVKEQVERNPLIRLNSQSQASATASSSDTQSVPSQVASPPYSRGSGSAEHRQTGDKRSAKIRMSDSTARNAPSLEVMCAARTTLKDHLRSQLMIMVRDPRDIRIGLEIVDSIEDDGYFRRSLEEIAYLLDVEETDVTRVLVAVQTFEPSGVGARNLSECLKLQLRDANRLTPQLTLFLDNLPLLAAYRVAELGKICRLDAEGVAQLATEIRKLEPRPGYRFATDPVIPALPDVIVRTDAAGSFTVELNTAQLPKVLVDREYYAEISAQCGVKDGRKFVIDCWNNANWLVRNLEQRAQTILRVATEVIARQKDFLLHGAGHLHPLNLRDVANALDLHESTVSRATVNKYVFTSRGTFELKFFFVNSISATDGMTSYSSETIRNRIRNLINSETAETIYSDDAIMGRLKNEGVDIARRTVAKYREEMNIDSSTQRKRQRMMMGSSETASIAPTPRRAVAY